MKGFASKFLQSKITRAAGSVALVVAVAASLAQSQSQSNKLEGSWIGKVPGTPVMWSYTLSPDPSGRSAAMSGSIPVPLGPSLIVPGLFPDLEYYSPMVGQATMTGLDTAEFTAVYYGMKKGFPFNQVVFIGVNSGQVTFTDPGKSIHTNHLAFYAPTADADHDGLPDPGQLPVLCVPASISLETRVPIMPPCTP